MASRRYLKELPPSEKGKYERAPWPDHVKIVDRLQKRPGVWVKVRDFQTPQSASAFAKKIRDGGPLAFRDGEYEAQARKMSVWARFVG
jgi:hypothetical protein